MFISQVGKPTTWKFPASHENTLQMTPQVHHAGINPFPQLNIPVFWSVLLQI